MVVTRLQSGGLSANKTRDAADLGNPQSPRTRTPKRKPRVTSGSGSIEDGDYKSSASKKRKIERVEVTKEEPEARTTSTRLVVEIPAMAPIPASDLSGSDAPVVEEQGALEDPESGKDERTTQVESGDVSDEDDDAPEEEGTRRGEQDVIPEELEHEEEVEEVVEEDEEDEDQEEDQEDEEEEEEEDKEDEEDEEGEEEHLQSTDRGFRHSKPGELPGLLPIELLQDDDETSTAPGSHEAQPQAKRIKFTDLVEKAPKDRRIGSTMYRINKPRNVQLAPTAHSQSRNIKEAWMQGQKGKNRRKIRKPFSKGFLVPKK